MAASEAQPEHEQAAPDGVVLADIETRVVDVLDRAPAFVSVSSRHLLLSRVERRIGGPLQVPDYSLRRQWFVGLVDACRAHPDGLTALAAAVADVEPASSPTVAAVRRLGADWNARADRAARRSRTSRTVWVDPAADVDWGEDDDEWAASDSPPASGVVPGGLARPREPERLGTESRRTRDHNSPTPPKAEGVLAVSGIPREPREAGSQAAGDAGSRSNQEAMDRVLIREVRDDRYAGSLSRKELQALAKVFHHETAARQVLAAAGLPVGRQPIWSGGMSPTEFWGEVNHQLEGGIIHDGRRRVLAAAAELYPGNTVFSG